MLKAATAGLAALVAVAAGVVAALGWGLYGVALVAGLALTVLGAMLPMSFSRTVLLAALLLVPDLPSGQSWGLLVRWSQGLTLSNFVVPALALPLLLGAKLAGRRLTPPTWPVLARWYGWLLAWCGLTLCVPYAAGQIPAAYGATLLAHLVKLAVFVWIGVVLAGGDRRLERVLFWGLMANVAFGLGQAAGWLPVFSPLGQAQAGAGARASGLFYDANMYGALVAWPLLWLLGHLSGSDNAASGMRAEGAHPAPSNARRWGWWLLGLALGGSLVAAGSRAGYLALAAGGGVLLWRRQWRTLALGALLFGIWVGMFPARSWQRVQAALATAAGDAGGDASAGARLASMREGLRQIAQHPVLGLGFGRALYLGVPSAASGPVQAAGVSFNGAQNMALTVLAETGPVGLALFLLAIGAPLRRLKAAAGGELTMVAGFVGLLTACFTIEALWNTRLLALVVLLTSGAVFARGRPAEVVA